MEAINKSQRLTMTVFFLTALLGGGTSVAIRFSNVELAPFWGATMRFAAAGLLFWLILFIKRIPLPNKHDRFLRGGCKFCIVVLRAGTHPRQSWISDHLTWTPDDILPRDPASA